MQRFHLVVVEAEMLEMVEFDESIRVEVLQVISIQVETTKTHQMLKHT